MQHVHATRTERYSPGFCGCNVNAVGRGGRQRQVHSKSEERHVTVLAVLFTVEHTNFNGPASAGFDDGGTVAALDLDYGLLNICVDFHTIRLARREKNHVQPHSRAMPQ